MLEYITSFLRLCNTKGQHVLRKIVIKPAKRYFKEVIRKENQGNIDNIDTFFSFPNACNRALYECMSGVSPNFSFIASKVSYARSISQMFAQPSITQLRAATDLYGGSAELRFSN